MVSNYFMLYLCSNPPIIKWLKNVGGCIKANGKYCR